MKAGYTDITFILDRSGSMEKVKSDTIGGFNEFLEVQRAVPGECTVSLYQFDTVYEPVYENLSLEAARELTPQTFVPRGGTALLDAIGRTINALGIRYSLWEEKDRPERVLVVILTDGEENSSMEFELPEINKMISHQRDIYKWDFIFLGANQDAIATASAMSISPAQALSYAHAGTQKAFRALSSNVANYRAECDIMEARLKLDWNDAQRKDQEKEGAWTHSGATTDNSGLKSRK